jgi:putative spermidine/putrescine transport system ATP-binding protein
VRPERIVVGTDSLAELDNVFEATVAEVIYMGDQVRLRVNAFSSDNFFIKRPATDPFLLRVQRGDLVRIAWKSEDCSALDHVKEVDMARGKEQWAQ